MTTIESPELTFDEVHHSYWLGSRRLPSVTEIIKPLTDLSHIPGFVLERKAWIGTVVHATTELYDLDELGEYDPDIEGYFEAWKRFRFEHNPSFIAVESRVWHPEAGYAGTIDRVVDINGNRYVLDIKTSKSIYPSTAIQLAAYQGAWQAKTGDEVQRLAVHLRPDSTFATHTFFDDEADMATFRACLAVHQWKEQNQ